MATELDDHAKDRSTYRVTMSSFTSSTGGTITPTSLTWTLRNEYNSIINSRSAVTATPSTSVSVDLYGADLVEAEGRKRKLIIDATYTSGGTTGLPLRDSAIFTIDDV